MLDFTEPEIVDISIRSDGKVVWINIDGVCALRACRIKNLVIDDQRPKENKNVLCSSDLQR